MNKMGMELKIIPRIPGVNRLMLTSFRVSIKMYMLEHRSPKKPVNTANMTAYGIGVTHNKAANAPSETEIYPRILNLFSIFLVQVQLQGFKGKNFNGEKTFLD